MNKRTVFDHITAFLIFASVTAASAFVFAFALYKTGHYDAVGGIAGGAVLSGSLGGAIYLKKRHSSSAALVGTGIFLASLVFLSLLTPRSVYTVPFLVPVCCAVGGVLPCLIGGKGAAKAKKRVSLPKRYRGKTKM